MIQDIKSRINSINESLAWLKAHKPEHHEARFLDLVEERRKLNKIATALAEKPSIAAFGESQKGKSYLIGNLLQKDRKPFMVRSGETGEEVDFVMNINPIGSYKEATGVVTRFTSFTEDSDRYVPEYPVIVKLFSIADIATILTDSYYSDILDYTTYSESEIEDIADQIYKKYADASERSNNAISEDDILDIKNYLEKFTTAPTYWLRRSSYFDKLARVIRRVPVNELLGVLQYLWHDNSVISELFTRLSATLARFGYTKEIYTSIEAVRHYGDNRNSFLSLDCLNQLDLKEGAQTTDIFIRETDGKMRKVSDVPKCEICALCAEAIFHIDKKYLSYTETYACPQPAGENGNMPSESANKLSRSVHKNLLKDMDLLDFPGARSRLKLKASFLGMRDNEYSASCSVKMLLHGKIAYLFNSYNENRSINILLFCHDYGQPAVSDMYNMVETWVNRYVGSNPAERRATMDLYGGISPLFVVSTKFNIDMTEKEHSEHNSMTALNQRWEGRFEKVLFRQVFKGESVEWVKNWDAPGSFFNNTYMLRDYKYSGCTGSGNNIYEGFSEKDESPEELKLHHSQQFYNDLRDSFINNETVREFFADPALSWDVAASRNNDGALYIIENLTRAASKADSTRRAQFAEIADASSRKLREMMSPFVAESDKESSFLKNPKISTTL